jgi:serine/threonine protein kinase
MSSLEILDIIFDDIVVKQQKNKNQRNSSNIQTKWQPLKVNRNTIRQKRLATPSGDHRMYAKAYQEKKRERQDESIKLEKQMALYISPLDPLTLYRLHQIQSKNKNNIIWATHIQTGQEVAIKQLQIHSRGHSRLAVILREIEIIASSSHRYIVKYYNTFRVGDALWIVLENMEYGSIYDLIQHRDKGITLSEEQIAYIIHCVIEALSFLHQLKRIHREVKVENMLINGQGTVKLSDFGNATQLTFSELHRTSLVGGSCMAPELIHPGTYNEKIDVWSVGIAIIEMVDGHTHTNDITTRSDLIAIGKGVPVSGILEDFVNNKCLHKDPSQRATATSLTHHPFLELRVSQDQFRDFLSDIYDDEPTTSSSEIDPRNQGKKLPKMSGCTIS